ncbi:GNAT family N-acetyltransferase [Nitriliruptor alkaliphilus]|uniref:GNAT family N-acetyltransferase n=1 Tax=Nitriliruptor alkaliphilus TaxID=427918 RepID=UPI000696531C|nr:GNAT family N-acetyltransferase [Nitriliruptor alkaliphilus]
MSDLSLHPVGDDEDELLAFMRAVSRHFHEDEADEDLAPWVRVMAGCRRLAVTDRDRIVANYGTLPVDLSVPGGATLPCAGVTVVGVSQTYRRRGLLRRMMTAGLDDAVAHEEPVAALYASESAIYPRFGFGIVAPSVLYHADATRTRFLDRVDPRLVVDLDVEAAPAEAAAIYEVVRAVRGGGVGRLPAQWEVSLRSDTPGSRGGASRKRRVHVPGRGYAVYRIKEDGDGALPGGDVVVLEFVATDPEAEQALWQHVFDVDLATRVVSRLRPPDDALPWMVEDRLRLRASEGEPLYARILDVPRCLASRTSAVTDGLVLAVHDADRDQSGTYRWDVSPEGGACTRTDAPADVALSIESLAACWLGGTSPSRLRAARRLEETTPGAVARLDRMTAVSHAPWTPWIF